MTQLHFINKLFCTLSAFCCGDVLHSQVPQDATFPTEIAEWFGLKMCDNYTLSYFVLNDPNDEYNSYNHGIIEQQRDQKGIKSIIIVDNYFNDVHKKDKSDLPSVDLFLRIDSVYASARGNRYKINVQEKHTDYSDDIYRAHLFKKKEQTIKSTIDVTEESGSIEKQWQNNEGEQLKRTVISYKGRKISDINENVTQRTKKSFNYRYDVNNLLTKVEHYNWSDVDSTPSLVNTFKYKYDDSNRLSYIEEKNRKHSVSYKGNDKISIYGSIEHPRKEDFSIEYYIDSEGFISAYKYYTVVSSQYAKRIGIMGSDDFGHEIIATIKDQLRSHGIVICK